MEEKEAFLFDDDDEGEEDIADIEQEQEESEEPKGLMARRV